MGSEKPRDPEDPGVSLVWVRRGSELEDEPRSDAPGEQLAHRLVDLLELAALSNDPGPALRVKPEHLGQVLRLVTGNATATRSPSWCP